MKKKNKILIWNSFPLKQRQGGPSTYLYNLKKSLEQNKIDVVIFANDYSEEKEKSKLSLFFSKNIKPLIAKIFTNEEKRKEKKKKRKKENTLNYLLTKNKLLPKDVEDLNDFSHIHFHTTFDYFKNTELLKKFKGKVLLTSHSPKVMHKEVFEDWLYDIELSNEEKKEVAKIDYFAFSNADYVIFPCKEAQEPYFNSYELFKDIKFKREVIELLTCCTKSEAKEKKENVLKKYNISNNAFVITYFGRHNEIKGYDLLKEAGKEILKKYKNVYFLIAGKEEPLKGLDHKRWIEIGWTQDPHSIVSASNLYILPNRETYFDLALLEVLSLGITSLISETGGNNFFKRLPKDETKQILFFKPNDTQDLLCKFHILYNKEMNKTDNKKLFQKYFSNENFANNYISMIKSI